MGLMIYFNQLSFSCFAGYLRLAMDFLGELGRLKILHGADLQDRIIPLVPSCPWVLLIASHCRRQILGHWEVCAIFFGVCKTFCPTGGWEWGNFESRHSGIVQIRQWKRKQCREESFGRSPIHEQASDQAAARRRSACSGHIMDIRGIAPANHLIGIPVVPHKAVAEVSKIGNL